AGKMVRLSGRTLRDEHNPQGDIAIEITGLRPGEKLHEELLIDGSAIGTLHPRILEVKESLADLAQLEPELTRFEAKAHQGAVDIEIRTLLGRWVTGYPDSAIPPERTGLRIVPSA